MKSILLLITVIFSLNAFSQSKKDQIQMLTQQLDSLIQVLNLERKNAFENSAKKDSIISIVNKQIEKLYDTINGLNSKLSASNLESINRGNQIESMKTEISNKSDSLKLLRELNENEFENTNNEFKLKYSTLNKPATPSMNEIGDWLSQFTLDCNNSHIFFDKKIAEFYFGDEAVLELHGKVTIQNSIYQEGIIFSQRREYEGSTYQLFIPLLNLTDAKKNIDKLCRNMGGCLQPDEMIIKYEETEFGTKVTWGGGC